MQYIHGLYNIFRVQLKPDGMPQRSMTNDASKLLKILIGPCAIYVSASRSHNEPANVPDQHETPLQNPLPSHVIFRR